MKRNKHKPGFTLMEIMAVLIIIGLLATLVGTQAFKHIKKAKLVTTNTNLKTLHTAVLDFYSDTGRYPTEEEGLIVLIEQPADVENWDTEGYLEQTELPIDGWNHDFIYERFPVIGDQQKQFVIRSAGPDGEAGTDDDLLSTDAR